MWELILAPHKHLAARCADGEVKKAVERVAVRCLALIVRGGVRILRVGKFLVLVAVPLLTHGRSVVLNDLENAVLHLVCGSERGQQ